MLIMLKNVKKYRAKKMLTLQELSEVSGASVGSIWTAEQGRPVSTGTARRIAKGLGVEPEKLV